MSWVRRQAGSYELHTSRGTYYVGRDSELGGWSVIYPNGEFSESAETMSEARRWAEEDAAR